MPRRTVLLAVYLPTTLLALGQGLLLATLPLYADGLGVSYRLVSFAVAAAAIGTLATDVPAGALLGHIGLRRAMIGGTALVAASTLVLAFARSFDQIVVLRLLAGVGTALWGLSRHAYIAESVPLAERGRTISVFGGINRIGVFGGPAIGGIIGDRFGLHASFVVAGVAGAIALLASILFLSPVTTAPRAPAMAVRWQLVRALVLRNGRDLAAASIA